MDRIPAVRSRRTWESGDPVSSLDGIGGIVRVGRCDSLPESPEFASPVMPSGFGLFRRTVPARSGQGFGESGQRPAVSELDEPTVS